MIKIAIVEDDEKDLQLLRNHIAAYCGEHNEKAEIQVFKDGMDFIGDGVAAFDLAFLDIDMPILNGLETAKKIRKYDRNMCIVFVTNMPQFAINGYEVEALNFIVKPVNYINLSMTMDKVLRLLTIREKVIYINSDGVVRLYVSQIKYIEVMGHTATFHTENGVFSSRISLEDLEEKVSGSGIYRINRYCMVNFKYVSCLKDGEFYIKDKSFKISKSKKKEIIKNFTEYLTKGL